VAVWSGGGHSVFLDDDGALTITSKDGSSVVLTDTGAITVTAGTGASVTVNVDDGQTVNIGDLSAVKLLKALASETHIASAFRYGTLPGNFAPNDGGVLALNNAANFIDGTAVVPPAIPGNSLTVAAGTDKALGS
jgi:hypothetical protein